MNIKTSWQNRLLNKFYIYFHFLSLRVFISVRNIPLNFLLRGNKNCNRKNRLSNSIIVAAARESQKYNVICKDSYNRNHHSTKCLTVYELHKSIC